jgi:hypothetical protein
MAYTPSRRTFSCLPGLFPSAKAAECEEVFIEKISALLAEL